MFKPNRIVNKDCLPGMKEMPDNCVDLVLTSPPYNVGIDYDVYDDNMDWAEYYGWCKEWLTECFRVLKPDGRIAVNHYLSLGTAEHRESLISTLYSIMEEIGFKHHTIALWTDSTLSRRTAWGSWLSSSAPYINAPYEGILIDYKEAWKRENAGSTSISKADFVMLSSGLWKIGTETHGLTKANFSVDFASKVIRLLTYEGDLVLDPFMGSGTTAVAAVNNKRNYIGFEISGDYCRIANQRIKNERTKGLF